MFGKLNEYNLYFIQNDFMGDLDNKHIFDFINHNSKVCLTAPHSTVTLRKDARKKSDLYTGAICRWLGEKSLVSNITRNRFSQDKYKITNFIADNNLGNHYFLDIHGMKSSSDFELAVGIADADCKDYEKELKIIDWLCRLLNISYVVNNPNYTGRFGLTGDLQKQGIKTVMQLEWRLDMRDFYHSPSKVEEKTIPFLLQLIAKLSD